MQDRIINIPRENRKCTLYNLEKIGDEFHYTLNSPYFKRYIYIYIKKRYTKYQILLAF
jgi:hypothetical protein